MPRYFFNVFHKHPTIDREGEELTDRHVAWKEATAKTYERFRIDRHSIALHALMVLFSLVPSLMGYTVYLTDIPNAVARITINLKLIADPSSSAFYFFRPVLIPNMALDVWGLLFGGWIGVENAVLIFVMLVIV